MTENIDANRVTIHYKLDINSNTSEVNYFTNLVLTILEVKSLEEAKIALLIKENRDKFVNLTNTNNISNIEIIYDPNMSYYGLYSWVFTTIIEKEVQVFNKFLNKSVSEKEIYKVFFGFQDSESKINNADVGNVLNASLPSAIPSPFPTKGPNITPNPLKYVKTPTPTPQPSPSPTPQPSRLPTSTQTASPIPKYSPSPLPYQLMEVAPPPSPYQLMEVAPPPSPYQIAIAPTASEVGLLPSYNSPQKVESYDSIKVGAIAALLVGFGFVLYNK